MPTNIIDVPGSPLNPDPEPEPEAGVQVMLPSSFIGSPRNMTEAYHDAMTVVRVLGHPDLFVTMTCNEKWPEILENLNPGQVPSDRPDLIARVFEMKKTALIDDIVNHHVLGHCVSCINVIEFQKRGKPHAHILIHLEDGDKFKNSSDIDSIVSAEIPDPLLFPELHAIVTQCMMHGPCGHAFGIQDGVCMKDGECTKDFPKEFTDHTVFSENGFPQYRRRDDGRVFVKNGKPLDNRWVVPYNAFLLLKYRCHINVEICVSIQSIKYLFKYVYKGHDCASVTIERDSIKAYLDARYICAPEAAHRLFEFKMRDMTFTVERLPVHLPDMQSVFFHPGEEQAALEKALQTESKLTGFFKLCSNDSFAKTLLYADVPLHYWWHDNNWKKRKNRAKCLTRMFHVSPLDSERFHLKLLLQNFPGPTSFDDLLLNDGVLSPTFKDSCKKRNLIEDDSVWRRTLGEAAAVQMPCQLREMFAVMVLNCDIFDPAAVWEEFRVNFCEDHVHQGDSLLLAEQKALAHVESVLKSNSRSLSHYGLPLLDPSFVHPEPAVDPALGLEMNEMLDSLNTGQRAVWDAIKSVHETSFEAKQNGLPDNEPKVFFVDGPGGSGKTYLYNFIIRFATFFGMKIAASAMTGIAATLLPGGQTAHKTFCIPIPCHENSTCRVSPSSEYGEKLRSTWIFIIDEASMLDRYQFEAIDRMMRDVTGKDVPFGGKIFILGGDFRQTLPVIRRGSDTAVVEKSLISSPLWSVVRPFHLTTNMRANDDEENFKSFLLEMGDGNLPLKNTAPFADAIEIPRNFITSNSVVQDVFPDDLLSTGAQSILKRAILSPTNKEATKINLDILNKVPGDMRMYSSVDTVDDDLDEEEKEHRYPTSFLNSQSPSGMPHHNIFLKEGAIAMLLRNINNASGLTNGVRVVIRRMHDLFLDVEILTGATQGKRVFIPRMTLTPSDTDLPFQLRRVQFPIRLAYAMTVNKSQGQSFDKVGIYLNRACFGHGQLYVGFSRAHSQHDISVEIVETQEQGKHNGRFYTKNVVLRRVLQP